MAWSSSLRRARRQARSRRRPCLWRCHPACRACPGSCLGDRAERPVGAVLNSSTSCRGCSRTVTGVTPPSDPLRRRGPRCGDPLEAAPDTPSGRTRRPRLNSGSAARAAGLNALVSRGWDTKVCVGPAHLVNHGAVGTWCAVASGESDRVQANRLLGVVDRGLDPPLRPRPAAAAHPARHHRAAAVLRRAQQRVVAPQPDRPAGAAQGPRGGTR